MAEILKREDGQFLGNDEFFKENLIANPHPEVRQACALALGRIGIPQALPWLYSALRTGDAAVRAASAFAIGEIQSREFLRPQNLQADPRAVPELVQALDDPCVSVRMRAAEALGRIGDDAGAIHIIRLLEGFSYTASPAARHYLDLAITALMRIKDPAAVPILKNLAGNRDPEIQWRAANALIRLQGQDACSVFVDLIHSPDSNVQAYAARGLGMCGDPSHTALLARLLSPRKSNTGEPIPLHVRFCALLALGDLKDSSAIPSIQSALEANPIDDAHPEQLNFAIQASATLGSIGTREAEAVVLRLLECSGPVADGAVVALGRINNGDPDRFFALVDGSNLTSPASLTAWARAMVELGGPDASEELKEKLALSLERSEGELKKIQELRHALAQSRAGARVGPETTDRLEQMLALAQDQAGLELRFIPEFITFLARTGAADLQEIIRPFFGSHDPDVLLAALAAYKPTPWTERPWAPILGAFVATSATRNVQARVDIIRLLEPWVREKAVLEALRRSLSDQEREVRLAAAALLRKANMADIPEDHGASNGYTTDAVRIIMAANRKQRTYAGLETTRGKIEIELFRGDAPITVARFVSLARRGSYDGLKFTRVIPFSYIQVGNLSERQGAEPGYPTRSDANLHPYGRGSIGIAFASTEADMGRFFITLSPQPLFDGRYTCFGRITSGMQVVDRIVPGDRIDRIQINEDVSLFNYDGN